MKNLLTPKQQRLLKKLIFRINHVADFIRTEGLYNSNPHQFVLMKVFGIQFTQLKPSQKPSKDYTSQTQEQTSSEHSDSTGSNLKLSLEKAIAQKISEGSRMDQLLVQLLENCYSLEEGFRDYLKSEEVFYCLKPVKETSHDFQKFRQKAQNFKSKKQVTSMSDSVQEFIGEPVSTYLTPFNDKVQKAKYRLLLMQESERQLADMRSFEKGLKQNIRKTKLLRALLQKQLLSEFSPFSFAARGSEEESSMAEIY